MPIGEAKDSGYICNACQEPINNEDLAYAEEGQAFHRNCLIV